MPIGGQQFMMQQNPMMPMGQQKPRIAAPQGYGYSPPLPGQNPMRGPQPGMGVPGLAGNSWAAQQRQQPMPMPQQAPSLGGAGWRNPQQMSPPGLPGAGFANPKRFRGMGQENAPRPSPYGTQTGWGGLIPQMMGRGLF